MSVQRPSEPYQAPPAPRLIEHPQTTRSGIIGRWCIANMLLILAAYCLLIVYPSYASGLYLASHKEIWANNWEVPLYGGFWSQQFHVVGLMALVVTIAAYYVATPMAMLVAFLAYRERRNLGWRGMAAWILIALFVPSVLWLTRSFGDTLFIWYFD